MDTRPGAGWLTQAALTGAVSSSRYHNAIADAVADLGPAEKIGRTFAEFQKYLYRKVA